MADRIKMYAQQVKDIGRGVMEKDVAKSNKPQSDVEVERSQCKSMTHSVKEPI